jgi:hypothetical protein
MPIKLELDLIHLIDNMREKHPHILDDILKDEYEEIKSHHRENIVITVLGSTKASKSSLINFILENNICPTGNQAATARLTRIIYGEKIRLTVCENEPEFYLFDNIEQLLEKAKEVIVLKNEYRKSKLCEDEILIELPINELKGVELWDVPGFDENPVIDKRIHEILNETNLILAVLSQHECLRKTTIDFIKPYLKQKEKNKPETKICFVISQIDRYKPDEQNTETRDKFLQHIYDKICQELPTNFPQIDYKRSDQFIIMCSSPRHSVKDYLECREQFIIKSCQWFHNALHRLTRQRTDLLLKCVKEFSNYENLFRQQKRYVHTREILNKRFLSFSDELSQRVNKKLNEIHLFMKQSIERIALQCRELFYRYENLEKIEEYIQSQLSIKFREILALKNPEIVEMISQMSIEFSNTIELKPPEIQILKQVLSETLNKDYYSSIIGQYHHTSPYHLSAYLTRICHALSETLKATIKISYGDFGEIRKAYDKFVRREKYVEDRTMSSITELVNEVLDIISDKLQQKTEKTVKSILNDQLEGIHKRIEKQAQKYIHSSSTDTKIHHLQQFFTKHSSKIKQMHLDILDIQFNLDYSSDYEINLQQRLDQNNHFPVFTGTLGEIKHPIAAKLIPLKDFQLQEVLYIRELKDKHVIKYHGVKKGNEDQYYIIMARLDCNLKTYLKDHSGTLTPAAIDDMIIQIITGLDYIHTQLELTHCDIKLDNILVNKEKKRFLIAHLGGGHREPITTEGYSASHAEQCDIYALGIMIRDIIRLANLEEQKDILVDGWLKLSKKCCAQEPTARPNCKKLLDIRSRHHE